MPDARNSGDQHSAWVRAATAGLVVVLIAILSGCESTDTARRVDTTSTTNVSTTTVMAASAGSVITTSTSTTTALAPPPTSPPLGIPGCFVVQEVPLLRELGIPKAAAFRADKQLGASSDHGWVVSDPNGASWATNIDPGTGEDQGGLILPLNDQARVTSDVGVDISPGAPIFGDYEDAMREAVLSRDCATALP